MSDGLPPDFVALIEYLKTARGFDFSGYKDASLMRRIRKRMQAVDVDAYEAYMDYLEAHPDEFAQLFNTVLINVTSYFRDQPAWEYLRVVVVPELLAHRPPDAPIRVWSAGCATGEEAYSLVITLAEVLGVEEFRRRVKIYATDLDEEALEVAREATADAKDLTGLDPQIVNRYFDRVGTHFVLRSDLRRCVIFGRHDLLQDAPISRVDLLVCRNTLIYFNAEAQGRILDRFHFALQNDGFLFLGKAEMLLSHTQLFTTAELQWRFFQKNPRARGPIGRDRGFLVAPPSASLMAPTEVRLPRLQDHAFELAPVAQLVLDRGGFLVFANAQARRLFGLQHGDIGGLHQDLPLSYRPFDLRTPINRAVAEGRPIYLADMEWPGPDPRYLDIHVIPLQASQDEGVVGVHITVVDVTAGRRVKADLLRVRHELEHAHHQLQATTEELETTNEELQSTVEELETTNEELQSMNEELETMNEELQATNDELRATNQTLQETTERGNADAAFLSHILFGIPGALVVLDREHRVTVWNHGAENLWGLRHDEVVGRDFFELDIGFPVDRIREPVQACLAEEPVGDVPVVQATNRRGKPVAVRVAISGLRAKPGRCEGVVVLMTEIGAREAAAAPAPPPREPEA